MERYLYFSNPNDTGAPNATQELAMYSTKSLMGVFAASATTTTMLFQPRDATTAVDAQGDTVILTHTADDHKAVFKGIASMVNAEKNNNPFQTVSDKENSIFNINGVTACAILSEDTDS